MDDGHQPFWDRLGSKGCLPTTPIIKHHHSSLSPPFPSTACLSHKARMTSAICFFHSLFLIQYLCSAGALVGLTWRALITMMCRPEMRTPGPSDLPTQTDKCLQDSFDR